MEKEKVIFVCVHNSARSQMAEAWLNFMYGDRFEARSAGLEPGSLNPLAVEAMAEVGIDISENKTKSVSDFVKKGDLFSWVITVCDETAAERCPVFPGVSRRLHWNISDPSQVTGTTEEQMEQVRQIRDTIKKRITDWESALHQQDPSLIASDDPPIRSHSN